MASAMTKEPPASGVRDDVIGVLDTISRFGDLLMRETKALQLADFKAVDGLQPEKKILARQYSDRAQALSLRKDEIGKLDVALREKFIRARTQFTILLNDNLRALDAARVGAKRLADRILEAARLGVVDERKTHYSARGHAGASKSATMSLSVDQQL